MNEAFGPAWVRVASAPGGWYADEEMSMVRERLSSLSPGGEGELLLFAAPPTAAFSRRDTLLPGYPEAERAVRSLGFTPLVRPVGGHLAVYDGGSLVLHVWAPHSEPRAHIRARFLLAGDAIAQALRGVGIDARVGPVPGEYCDGAYSVNRGGVAKLAGTGQRITGRGYLFSAVVMVRSSALINQALTEAYDHLGLELDPSTIGAVADTAPLVTLREVRLRLLDELEGVLRLRPSVEPSPAPPEPAVPSALSGS